MPHLINNYAIVTTRVFLFGMMLFLCLSFILLVKSDLNLKMQSENEKLTSEIAKCT